MTEYYWILKIAELGLSHEIIVPGFILSLQNDKKPPRQERTTVMARKLMDKIFDDTHDTDHLPRLVNSSKKRFFIFTTTKPLLCWALSAHSDFVVDDDDHFAKEHVSFVRDISGLQRYPNILALIRC